MEMKELLPLNVYTFTLIQTYCVPLLELPQGSFNEESQCGNVIKMIQNYHQNPTCVLASFSNACHITCLMEILNLQGSKLAVASSKFAT